MRKDRVSTISQVFSYALLLGVCAPEAFQARAQSSSDPRAVVRAPFEITAAGYLPSGYMGDGEQGIRYVKIARRKCDGAPYLEDLCFEVTYSPGSRRWAGVYWQSPPDNWGAKPGKRVVGASQVTFWARGTTGREVVEFKAGGISGRKFQDSFEASLGSISLSKEWRKYEIPLKGQDLSNVIGAFAWVATADANPGGLVFFLGDIFYR
jgi:hypothetical protein